MPEGTAQKGDASGEWDEGSRIKQQGSVPCMREAFGTTRLCPPNTLINIKIKSKQKKWNK